MTSILLIGLVVAVLMVFLGIFLRLLTGARMDLNDDVTGALSLLATLVLVIVVSFLTGSTQETFFDAYGEASSEVLDEFFENTFPFLKCLTEGRDALELFREDTADFFRELIHLLFMSFGLEIMKHILPTTARGKTKVGDWFIFLSSQLLLTVILAVIYAYVKQQGVVENIVGVIMSATTIALPIPAIVRVIISRNRDILRGAGLIATMFFLQSRTLISAGCYLIAISLMATHMPQVLAGLEIGSALLIAFAPCIIMMIGLGMIIKSVFFPKS